MPHKPTLLFVEDDPLVRTMVARYLTTQGLDVDACASCAEARAAVERRPYDVVLTDHRLADGDSLELLQWLRARDARSEVLVLSGYGTIDMALNAVREGARDFLTKPVDLPRLLALVQRSVESSRAVTAARGPTQFVAQSEAMRRFVRELDAVGRVEVPVLLLGETGTGKSTVAREIHARSERAASPFVDVNAGGLRGDFLESELFGHERGAFTGAVSAKSGLLESANGGTLFLDEIGDIELPVQAKILKVIEERRFRRFGDVRERSVDVRLIAATHRDLAAAVRSGAFREDLFYRINTLTLTVPPLRERTDDIEPLVTQILSELGARHGIATPELAHDALAALVAYAWPGNVRQLRNVLERAVVLHRNNVIHAEHLRFDDGRAGVARPSTETGVVPVVGSAGELPPTIRDAQRRAIENALVAAGGHVGEAARMLGMPRSTLYQKLRVLDIDAARFRTG